MASDSQRRAKKKYKAKIKREVVEFYPGDADIYNHLLSKKKKQTYIKNLIRADMARNSTN